MPTRTNDEAVQNQDVRAVLGVLQTTIAKLKPKERKTKVYHLGLDSYSWEDIASEIEAGTDFGFAFVGMIMAAARQRGIGGESTSKRPKGNPLPP